MPKYVAEIAQGNTFSETSENGQAGFQATRAWKVILNSPSEAIDINAVTGVNIGDPYTDRNPIPCVSIEGRPDGDSRLVRIITATYRATPGAGEDPKTMEPTVRPALYSMSTSLSEITAWGGRVVTGGSSGSWIPAVNPVGDLVDGVTKLEPIVNINIDQYSYSDGSEYLGYTGYVNSDPCSFSSLSIPVHCCMLQAVTCNPVVEQFGDVLFRGFKVSFTFAVRQHYTVTREGPQPVGWDMAIPQTGFNIINSGDGDSGVDQQALNWQHKGGKVWVIGANNVPVALAPGTRGKKVRALVTLTAPSTDDGEGGFVQRVASQPVALNDDGTPRSPAASPPVLINRVCLQPEMPFGPNFSNFGIRFIS